MTTFLKVFLIAFCSIAAIHFFPVLMVPVVIFGVLGALLLTLVSGGAVIALAAVGAVVALVAAVLVGIVAAAAPVAIPVLLVLGLIALIKSFSRQAA